MTAANSWPSTRPSPREASPIEPSLNQWASEPHRPTASTRSSASPSDRLVDRQLDMLERADAGEPDRGCGGVCDQEAESTAGLTTSASLSIVSRS